MKFFLISIALLVAGPLFGQKNIDSFSVELVALLKNNDSTKFIQKMFDPSKDGQKLMEGFGGIPSDTSKPYLDVTSLYLMAFRELRKSAETKGLNWNDVTYISNTFNFSKDLMFNLDAIDGEIIISSKGKSYKVSISKAVLIDKDWKIVGINIL